jgi:hypothetical protein
MNSLPASTSQAFFSPIPLNLRLEYNYSNFGSPALQSQAQETLQQFFSKDQAPYPGKKAIALDIKGPRWFYLNC